ncbi:MAG: hypothetical protein JWO79_1611, partial [Actinomycetia bacterium]|nr:hypothetical protein [Actinomycetes bacterium]
MITDGEFQLLATAERGVDRTPGRPDGGDPLDAVRIARVALSRLVEPGHRQLGELIRSAGAVEALDMLCSGEVSGGLRSTARARLESGDPREAAA